MRAAFLALSLILLLPVVQAQAPTSSVGVDGLSQKYVATTETQLVPVTVVLNLANIVCTQAVNMRVTLAAQATERPAAPNQTDNRSFGATVSPGELTFTVHQGAYGNNAGLPTARPYQGRQTATIAANARNLTNATSVDVAYKAAFAGYTGSDCRGSAGIGAASIEGTFMVDFAPTVAPPPAPTPKLPVPMSVVLAALAAAFVIMRRRSA